ncbi:metallophosphoesterase [Clostridium ljungdahlii]|uniref:Putative metallophosphoesterase n=1 Tax=Clostridium ljungdahlii TaxID=1538 RepID=A0A168M0Z5_9CLOT|nr:metallophosphoesterase [Clostridium ljungdahlii]OAA83963.1 putative metallophosphoesterase [Clostridium ljungdahlii]
MLIENIILLILILILYIIVWYYVGRKVKGVFLKKNKNLKKRLYWIAFWFIAFSYIISSIFKSVVSVNNIIASLLTIIGAVSLGIFYYLFILFLLTDVVKFVLKKVGFKGKIRNYISAIYDDGISIFIIVLIIFCFGMWNALHPVVTNYSIDINKSAGKINSLNVVMVSDVHMGIMIKEKGIDKMVNSINKLKPDIVFFCGDMVDESTTTKLKKYYGQAFKGINSKYGVYYITGNHEYGENLSETISYMNEAKVKVLQDKAVKIDNSFYVVGRKDTASGEKIKPLNEILKNTDKSLPIIELNHRPVDLEEVHKENVDLQLSGHTHRGQFFPNNLITRLIYEDDYGYLKKDNFNLIVTSGYGTWGPPIRIGTKGEIVNIKIKFKH